MRKYLSHGAGVDSTALMLLLLNEDPKFESVFIDHGGDYPETYEYVDYLIEKGYEITVLKPSVIAKKVRYDNIYDYFWHYKSVPFRNYRICTDKFKIQTFNKYVEKPCIVYLGYDWSEYDRARKPKTKSPKSIEYQYPLVEKRINRSQCKKIIRDHNLKVPRKSGCWFCPFQKLSDWKKLRDNYPELFKKAMAMEDRAFSARGKMGFLRTGKLSRLCPSGVQGLDGQAAYHEVVLSASRRPRASSTTRRRRQENKLTRYLEAESNG